MVYPNPTGGVVNFEMDGDLVLSSVQVFDALGRRVSATVDMQARQVDLSGLANGVYFVELRSEESEGVKRVKVLKQ